MIIIEEKLPRKISGLTSLFVSFDFNAEVVNIIKNCYVYSYDKATHIWELPINTLSYLLDSLTYYDDICLQLYKGNTTSYLAPLSEEEIKSFKIKPFAHQLEAVNYVLEGHPKYLNCFSMGVGKSLTAMITAEVLHKRGLIEHCLIINGIDSLRQQWKSEIQKFSNETVMVLGEKISKNGNISYTTVPERCKQLEEPINEFFIVVNAATIRDDKFVEAFKKSKNKIDMIVVDEVHKFATKSSLQGANLLKLKADYKIAMTGTPIVNSPLSIYVPLTFTENEHATLTNFKAQYCRYGGFSNHEIVGFKNLDILNDEIASCTLRKTLDQVRDDMPPRNVMTELVEMSKEHSKLYEAVKKGIREDLNKIELNSNNLLALTTRLRQATADPTILTTESILSSKIERCVELAEDLVESGEKVVILSTFKEPTNTIRNLLSRYNPLLVTGDTKETEAENSIRLFLEDPNYKIIIGTHGKLGTGKNLNSASYMICLDEGWTAAQNNQSFDRIWRVNNDRPAFVTVLLCKDTIDERVHAIAQRKQDLQDFMIDGKTNSLSQELKAEMTDILKSL